MGKETCSPAFPSTVEVGEDRFGNKSHVFYRGMTLRDYFAGQALVGIYANKGAPVIATHDSPHSRALICYAMADAMMEARK